MNDEKLVEVKLCEKLEDHIYTLNSDTFNWTLPHFFSGIQLHRQIFMYDAGNCTLTLSVYFFPD